MLTLAAIGFIGATLLPQAKVDETRTWMSKRGALLWEESFPGTTLSKDWRKGLGSWQVEGGVLKGAELPQDNHAAYLYRQVSTPDVVLQFSFKFAGAKLVSCLFKGDFHVAALNIRPDGATLRRMTGIGKTTKGADVDATREKLALDDGAWHHVVWEFRGDEMVATIDGRWSLLARVEDMSLARDRYEFSTRGGPAALFKDAKVWAAEADPLWPKTRVLLIERSGKSAVEHGYR